jgi:hypothetical protein
LELSEFLQFVIFEVSEFVQFMMFFQDGYGEIDEEFVKWHRSS